jgi:hypothetical protein
MNAKSVIGVIMVAILIGVVYVVFEKNFTGGSALSNSKTSSAGEMRKDSAAQTTQQPESSLINLPTPEPTPVPLTDSSNLSAEAESLQMRDYSTYFEELKDSVSSQ